MALSRSCVDLSPRNTLSPGAEEGEANTHTPGPPRSPSHFLDSFPVVGCLPSHPSFPLFRSLLQFHTPSLSLRRAESCLALPPLGALPHLHLHWPQSQQSPLSSSVHQGVSVLGREVFGELRLEMMTGRAWSLVNSPEATQAPASPDPPPPAPATPPHVAGVGGRQKFPLRFLRASLYQPTPIPRPDQPLRMMFKALSWCYIVSIWPRLHL